MTRGMRAAIAWATAAGVIVGVGWWIAAADAERRVVVLNPLDEPVTVRFGTREVRVAGGGRSTADLPTGALDVEVRGKDGRLVDRHYLHVPASGGGQAVYSVLGAAPIFRVNVVYTSRTASVLPDDNIPDGFTTLVGERFRLLRADYLFRKPPEEIELREGSRRTVKTHVDLLPGGWVQALSLTADASGGTPLAFTLAQRLRGALPGEWYPLGMAIQTATVLRGPDAAAAVAEEALNASPETNDWNWAYARAMRRAGRLAEVRERYQALATRAPGSAVARAVLLRILPRAGIESAATEALAAFPSDREVRTAAAEALLRAGRAREAAAAYSGLTLGPADENWFVESQVRALLATGRTREATEVALAGARVKDAAAEMLALYARVARLPGAQPKATPGDVLKAWAGENGEVAVAWVQAQVGELDPGSTETLHVPPSNHAMLEIVAWATRDPQRALQRCRATNDLALFRLPDAVRTLLALEAYRTGDRQTFRRLGVRLTMSDDEVTAWIDRGVEPEGFWRLDEDERAAYSLARARRLAASGLPVPAALVAAARADPLRGPAYLAATRWPRPERSAPPVQLVRDP
jgi:hypothetical protein